MYTFPTALRAHKRLVLLAARGFAARPVIRGAVLADVVVRAHRTEIRSPKPVATTL